MLLFGANTKFQEGFGTVGLTAGYNWQFGHTVLGIEGDYNWANVDKTKASLNDNDDDGSTTRFKMNEFATLRGRAGLALDRTLIYATAGVAFAHIHNTTTFTDTDGSTHLLSVDENKWKTGLAVGAGVEFALTPELDAEGRIHADAVPELGRGHQLIP